MSLPLYKYSLDIKKHQQVKHLTQNMPKKVEPSYKICSILNNCVNRSKQIKHVLHNN